MAWGIPGNVGEIYRKQQSDELKDQLLQQEMAARMREADLRQQELSARIAEQRQMEAERAKAAERQTSLDLEKQLSPGAQTPAAAAVLRRYPATAARLSTARLDPAFGTPPIDVLAPNEKQAADATTLKERNAALEQISADPRLKSLVPLLRGGLLTSVPANAILPDEPKAQRVYKVPAPGGGYMNKSFSPEEEAAGIRGYVEPPTPRQESLIPVSTVDAQGNAVTEYLTPSEARGRQFPRTVPKKPPTGLQNTALGYYKRMDEAIKTMDQVEKKVTDKDIFLINNSPLPNLINNSLLSEAGQLYAQALTTYTEARLRKESGAAIAQHEFAQDRQAIGRQVNDTPKVIQQKQQTRKTTARGFAIAAGPAYEQEFGEPLDRLTPQHVTPGGGLQDWLKVPAAERPVGAEANVPNLGPSRWTGRGWAKK